MRFRDVQNYSNYYQVDRREVDGKWKNHFNFFDLVSLALYS